jgi:hypothetical protein
MKYNHRLTPARKLLFVCFLFSLQSCYQYRVLNTTNDPATEYQKKVLWSSFWGLVNKPKNFVVPNCSNSNALDEVQFQTNFGYSLITVATLGILSPVQVRWKCHKPCQREGGL